MLKNKEYARIMSTLTRIKGGSMGINVHNYKRKKC